MTASERRLRATVRNMQQLAWYKAVDLERLDKRLEPILQDKINKCEATIANTKKKIRGIGNVHDMTIPEYDMS